jgi:hypothetical protein
LAAVVDAILGKKVPKTKTLQDVGISSIKNETRNERLKEYEKARVTLKEYAHLSDKIILEGGKTKWLTPEEKIGKIIDGINEINDRLQTISFPYGGAGTTQWYAKAAVAWSTIYSYVLNGATACQDYLQTLNKKKTLDPARSKRDSVKKFYRTLFQLVYLDCAQVVLDYSWDKEVHDWAVVVNQPPVGQSREGLNVKPNPEEATYGG